MKYFIYIFIVTLNYISYAQAWENIGPFQGIDKKGDSLHTMGFVSGVWLNPKNNDEMLMSTNSSGIWKTTNRGENWKCVTSDKDFIPGMGCQSFSVNPSGNGEIIVAAANYVYGDDTYMGKLLKSNDFGDTWNIVKSLDVGPRTTVVRTFYHTASEIYVAVPEKIYKSTNNGKTWDIIFEIDKDKPWIDQPYQEIIDFVVFDSEHIVVTSSQKWGNTGQIWNTSNGGESWNSLTNITGEFKTFFFGKLSESTGKSAFLASTDGKKVNLYKTVNKGKDFSYLGAFKADFETGGLLGTKFEIEASVKDPNKIYLGMVEFFQWTKADGLKMLSPRANISKGEHDDVRVMHVYIKEDKEYILMGNDGGVSLYNPAQKRFKSLNGNSLSTLQVYKMGLSQGENYKIVIGTQDNGSFKYEKATNKWTWIAGGDGGASWFSEFGDKYINTTNQSMRLSYDNSRELTRYFNPSKRNSGWFIDYPLEFKNDENTMYYGSVKNWGAKGATLFVNNIKERARGKQVMLDNVNKIGSIAVGDNESKIVFVAATDFSDNSRGYPKFLKSTDEGNTFKSLMDSPLYGYSDTFKIKNVLDYRSISDIEIDPIDPEIIYATLTGFSEKVNPDYAFQHYRVIRSVDGGASWEDISNGLPDNFPAYKIIRHAGARELMFCGTDKGVYYRSKKNKKWKLLDQNFPRNTTVTDLKINYITQELFASTYGRGVWKMKLPEYKASKRTISSSDTLSNNTRILKENIYIGKKKEFYINSNLTLAKGVTITLAPKSTLVIDGAIIRNGSSDDKEAGIIIEEKKYFFFFKRKKGKVILLNNGKFIE